jgi:hypothetical protein
VTDFARVALYRPFLYGTAAQGMLRVRLTDDGAWIGDQLDDRARCVHRITFDMPVTALPSISHSNRMRVWFDLDLTTNVLEILDYKWSSRTPGIYWFRH